MDRHHGLPSWLQAVTARPVWKRCVVRPQVASVDRPSRPGSRTSGDRPPSPNPESFAVDDLSALCAVAAHCGLKVPRGTSDMTIAVFVALTGGLAGFGPSRRQSLPGTHKLWGGAPFLPIAFVGIRTMREWNTKTEETRHRIKCDGLTDLEFGANPVRMGFPARSRGGSRPGSRYHGSRGCTPRDLFTRAFGRLAG